MANFNTVAEMIAVRKLAQETRSGVPHFKVGQQQARIIGKMAQLTYVDVGGHMVMLIVEKRDGEWFLASTQGIRAGQFYVETVNFPRSFQVTEGMQAALLRAEEANAAKKKGAARGTTPGTTPSEEG